MNAIEYMQTVIDFHNYLETKGIVILKNGMMIKVMAHFNFFQEEWLLYNKLYLNGTPNEKKEFLEGNPTLTVSNGEVTILLSTVAAFVSSGDNLQNLRKKID